MSRLVAHFFSNYGDRAPMPKRHDRGEQSTEPHRKKRKMTDQVSGAVPGSEADGGESVISGRSRERHPAVPEETELPHQTSPPEDDRERAPDQP